MSLTPSYNSVPLREPHARRVKTTPWDPIPTAFQRALRINRGLARCVPGGVPALRCRSASTTSRPTAL